MKRIFLWLSCLVLAVAPPQTDACPFCLAPLQTWSEIVSEADAVCQARLISSHAGEDDQQPWSVMEFTKVHKGKNFRAGEQIRIAQYVYGKPGDLYLMTGQRRTPIDRQLVETFATDADGQPVTAGKGPIQQVSATADADSLQQAAIVNANSTSPTEAAAAETTAAKKVLQWDYVKAMSAASCEYIFAAPAREDADRLLYYLRHLEHPDEEIAADAWGEFAASDYETICKVRADFDAAKIRQWIARENLIPQRLGLYGMMLGLCGDADDAVFLQEQILSGMTSELRFGIEGLMGGLMLITADEGLTFLEERLISRADLDGAESYAIVQALQFAWTYEPDLISKERLRSALHPMLENERMREIVIRNMSRWNDWSAVGRMEALYQEAAGNDQSTASAVVGFLLTCRKSTTADEQYRNQADQLLQTIEASDPRIVRMMKMQIR